MQVRASPLPQEARRGVVESSEYQKIIFTELLRDHFDENLLFIDLNKSLSEEVGWIITESPKDDDISLRAAIVEESLGRITIGIELVYSREILSLLKVLTRTPQESDKQQELEKQLLQIPNLLIRAVNAHEVTLDLTGDRTEDHYSCTWQDKVTRSSKRTRSADEEFTPSPHLSDIKVERLPGAGSEPSTFMVRVPLKGVQDQSIGTLRCKGKRNEIDTTINLPFDRFDIQKLQAIADLASTTVSRTRRHRSIEVLLVRHVHELRNPVSSLRNIVRWLQKELTSKEISADDKIWTRMKDAELDVETLRQLTDLVDIFRGQASEKPNPTKIFGDIILKAIPQLRHRLHRLGVDRSQIQIDVEDLSHIPPLVVVKSHFQQIVGNLIDNAVKYRKTGAGDRFRIRFRADFDGKFYKVFVSDWGIGIPRGWETRIFADGERAPNAIKLSVGGMGVGLHIARELALRINGDLTLISRENPTEFLLDIPKGLRDDPIHGRRTNN